MIHITWNAWADQEMGTGVQTTTPPRPRILETHKWLYIGAAVV